MSPTPALRAAPPVQPTVLAIDTTAGRCSVALLSSHARVVRAAPMVHGHARFVLPMVDTVLSEARIDPAAIDAIGFGSGPGSFTGLRIACGIAQGLAFGWNRPVVPVDAMRTLALQAVHEDGAQRSLVDDVVSETWVLVALDLRMGEVCHAVFRIEAPAAAPDWPMPRSALALGAPDAAIAAFDAALAAHAGGAGRIVLAGDGFDASPALAGWAAAGHRLRPVGAVLPDAAAVARLAAMALRRGHALDAALAAPTYLRDKVALDVGEQAALRASRAAVASR